MSRKCFVSITVGVCPVNFIKEAISVKQYQSNPISFTMPSRSGHCKTKKHWFDNAGAQTRYTTHGSLCGVLCRLWVWWKWSLPVISLNVTRLELIMNKLFRWIREKNCLPLRCYYFANIGWCEKIIFI